MRVSHLNPAQDRFDFTVTDAHGPVGTGTADHAFTSANGQVTIDPQDWNIAYAREAGGKALAKGTSFTMERRFVCGDQAPVPLRGGGIEQRHVLATGLANGHHTVDLLVRPGAPAITEIRAYHPSLADPG